MNYINNLRLILGAEAVIMSTTKGIGMIGKGEEILSLFVLLVKSLNEEIEEEAIRNAFELSFKTNEEIKEECLKK